MKKEIKKPEILNFRNSKSKKSTEISTKQDAIKDLQNLNAQTNNLCESVNQEFGSYEWSEQKFQAIRKEHSELAYLFLFQYETSCRLSEAQLLDFTDILSDGRVKLKATKNSKDRIVEVGRCVKYLIHCRKARCGPFKTFNRFFIHRLYKKHAIIFQSAGSRKQSTTHAIRHAKVAILRKENIDNELISESLGHKNQKNQQYYGKEKNK